MLQIANRLLTLTVAIVKKYYWENALSIIKNAGWAATHGGLACRVRRLVCDRSTDQIPGEPPIIAHPISHQMENARENCEHFDEIIDI